MIEVNKGLLVGLKHAESPAGHDRADDVHDDCDVGENDEYQVITIPWITEVLFLLLDYSHHEHHCQYQ